MKNQNAQTTRLGELISEKMAEKKIDVRDLAEKLDITYEHVRRIARGEGIPSKFVLKLLSDELGIPYKEAEQIATSDKIIKKYGTIPLELYGKQPSLEPLERVWGKLTEEQQDALKAMANSFIASSKKNVNRAESRH